MLPFTMSQRPQVTGLPARDLPSEDTPPSRFRQFHSSIAIRTRVRSVVRSVRARSVQNERPSDRSSRNDRLTAPITVCCIYRTRNAAVVRHLLNRIGHHADVRLWALDEVAPELEPLTVGSGPGGRPELLNACAEARPIHPDSYLAVMDDDVLLLNGTVADLIVESQRAGFNLSQPGHGWSSALSLKITRSRPGIRARRTGFVEIGPLFVIDPLWRDRLFPLGAGLGMGWALQADFTALAVAGCEIGIIDRYRMIHLNKASGAYDADDERIRMEHRFEELGLRWEDHDLLLYTEGQRWSRWQPTRPW